MTWSTFTRHLVWISAALVLWSFIISRFGHERHILYIYLISVASFILFSYLIFLYAVNTSKSDDLFSFNNVVVASFLCKLILSIGLIIVFDMLVRPPDRNHILHFIVVYVAYTAYEVHFLTRLAKSSE